MPFFKTTANIFKDNGEYFDENWLEKKYHLPEKTNWKYDKQIFIEDVDIWEIIHYNSHGPSVYAAWSPYAEYYIIVHPYFSKLPLEEYYGEGCQVKLQKRMTDLNVPFSTNLIWVENEMLKFYV
jgi:hypothetical protein